MTARVGTIDDAVHVGDAKAIAGHDETFGAIDEACQHAIKMILADVLVGSIRHKDSLLTDSQGTIVGIVAASLPFLRDVSQTVIHFDASGEQSINVSIINGDVTKVAGRREVGLQFTTHPIYIDVIRRGNIDATALHLHCINIVRGKEAIDTTVGRDEIFILLQQNVSFSSLGIIEKLVGSLEHVPHATSDDRENHPPDNQRTRYFQKFAPIHKVVVKFRVESLKLFSDI